VEAVKVVAEVAMGRALGMVELVVVAVALVDIMDELLEAVEAVLFSGARYKRINCV